MLTDKIKSFKGLCMTWYQWNSNNKVARLFSVLNTKTCASAVVISCLQVNLALKWLYCNVKVKKTCTGTYAGKYVFISNWGVKELMLSIEPKIKKHVYPQNTWVYLQMSLQKTYVCLHTFWVAYISPTTTSCKRITSKDFRERKRGIYILP